MNIPLLFDTIILSVHQAKRLFIDGGLADARLRLTDAVNHTTVLLGFIANAETGNMHVSAVAAAAAVAAASAAVTGNHQLGSQSLVQQQQQQQQQQQHPDLQSSLLSDIGQNGALLGNFAIGGSSMDESGRDSALYDQHHDEQQDDHDRYRRHDHEAAGIGSPSPSPLLPQQPQQRSLQPSSSGNGRPATQPLASAEVAAVSPSQEASNVAALEGKVQSLNSLHNPAVIQALDDVFFAFLARICGDLDACDNAGNKMHLTMTAKRASQLTDSDEFMTFKFKIRPFVNAFQQEVRRYTLNVNLSLLSCVNTYSIDSYLSHQRYICRFGDDGRKIKSKGFFCWVVEARKVVRDGQPQWLFRDFAPEIVGMDAVSVVQLGEQVSFVHAIADPQMKDPKAVFSSPWLPYWLKWDGNRLCGIPDINSRGCEITVVATYSSVFNEVIKLERTVELVVVPAGSLHSHGGSAAMQPSAPSTSMSISTPSPSPGSSRSMA
ncbi:hypothetical protein BC831DRAFT_466116 [Entophlyctis helioformis]|nr:hypothetical protein BC831DRAFT_466116 [Entophlyctis helioformis]